MPSLTKPLKPNRKSDKSQTIKKTTKGTKSKNNKKNQPSDDNQQPQSNKMTKSDKASLFFIIILLLLGVTTALFYYQDSTKENKLIDQQSSYIKQGHLTDAQTFTKDNITNRLGMLNKNLYNAYNNALIKYSNSIPQDKFTYKKYKFLMTLTNLGPKYIAAEAQQAIKKRYNNIMHDKYTELYNRFDYVITDKALHNLERDIDKFNKEEGNQTEWITLQERMDTFKKWRANAY